MVKGKTKMSTYRYRDAAGDINIAAKNLTADTATIADLEMNTFTVKAFEPVSSQGLHLQWSKNGDGAGYIINQQGGGAGGLRIGQSTTGNVFTPFLEIMTNLTFPAIGIPVGRLDVTGTAGNGNIPTQGFSAVTTALGCTLYVACAPGGNAIIDFVETGAVFGRVGYNPTDNSMSMTALAGGPVLVGGQFIGPIPVVPVNFVGHIDIDGAAPIVKGTASILRKQTTGGWVTGAKVFISLPIGHYIIGWAAFLDGALIPNAYAVQVLVDGHDLDTVEMNVLINESAFFSSTFPVDITVDNTLVRLNTTSGDSIPANTCKFNMYAQRIA